MVLHHALLHVLWGVTKSSTELDCQNTGDLLSSTNTHMATPNCVLLQTISSTVLSKSSQLMLPAL